MKNSGEDKYTGPLLLICSPREKMRRILCAGLTQGNFRVMQADSLYTAGVKANQYVPDLVILDIAKDNIKDFLFIERLQKSIRTRNVAILVSVTEKVHRILSKTPHIETDTESSTKEEVKSNVRILEYPFHFADLLKEINSVMQYKQSEKPLKPAVDIKENTILGNQLFDFQITVQTKLIKIESSLQHKWAFPFTVIKALDIISTESGGCRELGKCIESDLAAASSLIRVANAVYYAKRDGRISDVTDAVVRIGFHETRNLLACLAFIEISPEVYKRYGFSRREFWMHSLATAVIAEALCKNCRYDRPELGFVAGLVHDLGKIPLDNNFNQVFPRLLEDTTHKVIPFYEAEQYLMGFTHADLGHYLTTAWNFPETITHTILHHHNPGKIQTVKSGEERILQEAVYVANIFAKALNLGHSCDEVLGEIPNRMLRELQIPRGPKRTFFNTIFQSLKIFIDYLNLPKKDLLITKPCPVKRGSDFTVVFGENIDFHPIVLALENRGYCVKIVKKITPEMEKKTKIAIFIPDKGSPLDIVLESEEEESESKSSYLKMFLLEDIDTKQSALEFNKGDTILMDRHTCDIRLVLHAFDEYLENVVVPEQTIVEE